MNINMGRADRLIRLTIATLIIVLYSMGIVDGTWGVILIVIAAILLLTGLVAFCPMYVPFGLNTSPTKENK